MAPISKCLLLALSLAAVAQSVVPSDRATDTATDAPTVPLGGQRAPRARWPMARAAVLAALRNRRPIRLMRKRVCLNIHTLLHGEASCNDRGCNLTCNPGYEFGNTAAGGRTLSLRCDASTGSLLVDGRRWTSGTTLCTPVMCATPCQNGGTCVAPNRCACPGAYTGSTCSEDIQMGDRPYKNYYPGPLASNQRRVECEPGTHMPDGSTSVTLTFKDNSWFFPDGSMMIGAHQVECLKDNTTTPAAAPSALQHPENPSTRYQRLAAHQTLTVARSPCGAPCLNKGVCNPSGTCTCRPGYAGSKCEHRVCRYPRFEYGVNATPVGNLLRMTFWCRSGHVSPRGDAGVTAVCEGGHWRLDDGTMLTEDAVKCTRQ